MRQATSLRLHRKSYGKSENPIGMCTAYVSSCTQTVDMINDAHTVASCFIVLHTTILARVRYCCCWMVLYQNTTVCRPFSIRRALNTNGWTNASIASIVNEILVLLGFSFSNEDQRLPKHHKIIETKRRSHESQLINNKRNKKKIENWKAINTGLNTQKISFYAHEISAFLLLFVWKLLNLLK